MAGRASQKVCVAVMYFTPDHPGAPAGICLYCVITFTHFTFVSVPILASSSTGSRRRFRIEERGSQGQRFEDFRVRQLRQLLSGKTFQEGSEQNKTEVAVNDSLAGLVFKGLVGNRGDRSIFFAIGQNVQWP